MPKYSQEPDDVDRFNRRFQSYYNFIGRTYDCCVKILPFWRKWLLSVLPFVQGESVLEAGFGTGYLLTVLAEKYAVTGIDLNENMVQIATRNLEKAKRKAVVLHADVANMPFDDESFDTVIATMSFPAIGDIGNAMREIKRVLKPHGKLLIVAVHFPADNNLIGDFIIRLWKLSGEVVRDTSALLHQFQFSFSLKSIGAFGTVQLYIAEKL